jgi:hypothetical protein
MQRCGVCGQRVAIHHGEEGTSFYIPLAEQRIVELEKRESLLVEALKKIKENSCEVINERCSSCDAKDALEEWEKLKHDSNSS